jgi:hypothetical protein
MSVKYKGCTVALIACITKILAKAFETLAQNFQRDIKNKTGTGREE